MFTSAMPAVARPCGAARRDLTHSSAASRVAVSMPLPVRPRAVRVGGHRVRTVRVSAQAAATSTFVGEPEQREHISGLNGQAMKSAMLPNWPTKKEILGVVPEHCMVKDTAKSMMYAVLSTAMTVGCGLAAYAWLPLQAAWTPAWIAYALVTGTVATGAWVVAHECGHGAFSDNKTLQDTVGYILHTLLLVPYFSWQRSHAVHHNRTNHITEGETHVPDKASEPAAKATMQARVSMGDGPFAILHTAVVLLFGWPVYLLTGASGGPVRGKTNHFWPWAGAEGKHALFPGGWKDKVLGSDVGIVAFLGLLGYWAYSVGSAWPVLALYGAPYLVTNAWLVLYTWLQHTAEDVPHFGEDQWTWEKGAFMTIDRPYGPVFDFLHHRIGSTHVAHHLNHQIPHYHAKEATEAIKAAFPQLYLYDPTPVWKATLRVAAKCVCVEQDKDGLWVFKQPKLALSA